jgi:hypothetical protein
MNKSALKIAEELSQSLIGGQSFRSRLADRSPTRAQQ